VFLYWHVIAIAMAYLFGGLLTGYYLVRLRTAEDVRLTGSGSAGARNVGRRLGKIGFTATLVGDAVKGALVVALARWFEAGPVTIQLLLLAVVTGHIWPLHLGFRGGKGIAPALGGLLVLDILLTLLAVLIACFLCLGTRRATMSGLLAAASFPMGAYVLNRPPAEIVGLSLLLVLILLAHRDNISEIFKTSRSS
jgi:glycerol-3-phosphate acyltransferase PlsY